MYNVVLNWIKWLRKKANTKYLIFVTKVSHEEWCDSNKYFRERKRALMVAWQNGRAALYHKAESIFTESEMAAALEEVKAEYNFKQKQVREVLHEKVLQNCGNIQVLTLEICEILIVKLIETFRS